MTVDSAWYLSEAKLALADVRVALSDVAARHAGIVIRRAVVAGAPEKDLGEDLDTWSNDTASFKIGFPAEVVVQHGDAPDQAPDVTGLHWGEIFFSQGLDLDIDDDDDDDDVESAGASMLISSTLSGGDRLWATLSEFADEVAAELGARSEEEIDADLAPGPEQAMTWTQIRLWIRREELEIVEEDAEHVTVLLHWEHDGRSQRVTLGRETRLEAPWLRLTSFLGKEELLPAAEALYQNGTLLGAIALSDEDKLLYMVQRIPLAAVTPTFLDTLLWDLGAEADLLESEISGGLDEY